MTTTNIERHESTTTNPRGGGALELDDLFLRLHFKIRTKKPGLNSSSTGGVPLGPGPNLLRH